MSLPKQRLIDMDDLMSEWDWEKNQSEGFDPNELTHGSTKKVFWICRQGHSFRARIDHRCVMKSGCPYCSGKLAIVGVNDIETLNPELIKEWDFDLNPNPPSKYKQGSNQKVWWICSTCKHKWKTAISNRALRDSGCPECAKLIRGSNKVKTLVSRKGSFQEHRPDLAKEWDNERNSPLKPSNVTIGSKKIVWWLCGVCGHSYQKSVVGRCNGNNCPACNGKTVVEGYNDLATRYPKLALEWHPTNNNELLPTQVTSYNDKKIWWQCPKCNHAWEATIYSRTRLDCGCPSCSGHVVIVGKNDLQTVLPEVAKEWHPTKNADLTPLDVSVGSNKEVWWECSNCSHEWKAVVSSRSNGRGCPICAQINRPISLKKTLIAQRGSLMETDPALASEWHPTLNGSLMPSDVLAGSNEKVWWQCSKGHSWTAAISSRKNGNGCPICSGWRSTSFPEQAIFYYLSKVTNTINRYKLDGYEIDVYLPDFSIGIEYNGRYYHRNKRESDVRKVSELSKRGIRVIQIQEGDKTAVDGDIIYYKYINRAYENLSSVIHTIQEMLSLPPITIDIRNDAYKIQEMYLDTEKGKSLAKKYPKLINEWHNEKNGKLTPWQVSYGSDIKVWWKCTTCNYEWRAVVSSRRKSGCPRCAGRVVTVGINDLASQNVELAKEWDFEKNEILPTEVTKNSHKYVWWKCNEDHSWKAQIKSRNQGCGCPVCKENKAEKSSK